MKSPNAGHDANETGRKSMLTRGATIYELSDEQRATMRELQDAGLVVSIRKYAELRKLAHEARTERDRLKAVNEELRKALEEYVASVMSKTGNMGIDSRRHTAALKQARAALAKAKA